VCFEVVAPLCETTATNVLSKTLNHLAMEIDYLNVATFTESEWCDSGVLDYSISWKKKSATVWNTVALPNEEGKNSFANTIAEQDLTYETWTEIRFSNSIYG